MKTLHGNEIKVLGNALKVGDKAKEFTLVNNSLGDVHLKDIKEDFILLSTVPSLDTGVCDFQTRNINEKLGSIPNVKFITVSMDLPFAQARWCGAAGLEITTLSDYQTGEFGKNYGLLIDKLRLLARAVFVLNKDREVVYVEYLDEMGNHPNYDALFNFLKTI